MKSLLCRRNWFSTDGLDALSGRYVSFFTVVMTTLFLCGCSSFNRAWKHAGATPAPSDSIEGRWEGHWLSAKNGHHGNLRCLITKQGDAPYEAHFRATYMKILRFSYKIGRAHV